MENVVGINQRAKEYGSSPTHRAIWVIHNGEIPNGMVIHHKNGDKKDNRIENLECLTKKEHGLRHRKPDRIRIFYPSGAIKVKKLIRLTE